MSVKNSSQQTSMPYKSCGCVDSDSQQHDTDGYAGIACQTLRALSDSDAPVNQKEPDAVCEMPDGCSNADDIDCKNPCPQKLAANNLESLVVLIRHRFFVEPRNQPEAKIEDVKR